MGIPDVEQATRRLQDILRKAHKLEIATEEIVATRGARKLLSRSKHAVAWSIWIGVFVIFLSGIVYARWPTREEVQTIRTVLRRTCPGSSLGGEFSEGVATLLRSSSTTQDDC